MLYKIVVFSFIVLGSSFVQAQNADFSASTTTICVGQSVQFNDLSTGATTYAWTFPDGGIGQTSTLPSPSITYTNPGTYNVTLTVTSGANSDTEIKTAYITVLATATATLTSGAGTDSQVLCIGSFMSQIVYDVQGATGATFSALPGSVTGTFTPTATGGTVIFSGLPTPAGTYPFSFTTTGPNCAPVTVNASVTVGALNGLTVSSGAPNQLVCVGTPITDIVFNVAGSPSAVTTTGLPPGITGTLSGSTYTISGTPTVTGSYSYTVTAVGAPCTSVQFSGGIAVDPDIQLASAPTSTNQTLCVNSPLGNIVYNLGPSITGASVTGLPAGVTGTYNPGTFLITYSPSAIGVYNYTITTSGGSCGPATTSGSITVHEPATLDLDVPGSNMQTVCQTDPITNITYTAGGGATGANVTGLPTGITGVYNAGIITISGTSTQVGTFNYTVSTTGTVCGPEVLTGTLVVDEVPNLQLISPASSTNQQVCVNTPMDTIAYVLTGTATSTSFSNLPAGVNTSIQNDTILIFGTPSALGSFSYAVFTSGGACPPDTAFGIIAIGPVPAVNLVSPAGSNNQVLCGNDNIDPIVYSLSGGATTATAINLPPGITSSFIGGVLTITGSPTQGGTTTFGVVASGGFCPNDTVFGTIDVFSPQLTLVSSAGTNIQQDCIFSEIDTVAYVFSGGATGATAINLPLGVTSSVQNDTLYLFGNFGEPGVFPYTVFTTGSPCDADSSYGLFTVDDSSGVILLSDPSSVFQTVLENQLIDTIVYLLSGNADTAVVTGLPNGVTAVMIGDTLLITGSSGTIAMSTFSITVSGGPCPSEPVVGAIQVLDKIDTLSIFVPNVFSPNNDQQNDEWSIQTEHAEKVELLVMNRWGNIIFQSDLPNESWDGTGANGSQAQDGVYFYKALVHGKDGSKTPLQGFFHLTR